MKIDSSPLITRLTPTDGKDPISRGRHTSNTHESTPAGGARANVQTDTSQDINEARVAEIRQAISEGKLTLNAERIADGLINSVRELLGR